MWYTVTCSYTDWRRGYKRSHPAHSHQAQSQFIVAAKQAAVLELAASGQPRFANVPTNQIGTTGLQVNLPNDPGVGFQQI
jgi:hypothetical protein